MKNERSLLGSILSFRCPRCREGKMFPYPTYSFKFITTNKACPCCGQTFLLEPGFFLGSAFFSRIIYAILLVALAVIVYRSERNTSLLLIIVYVLVVIFGLLPVVLRLSKSAWIHIFIRYEGPCRLLAKKP